MHESPRSLLDEAFLATFREDGLVQADYDAVFKACLRVALRKGFDEHTAEDLAQAATVKLWRSADRTIGDIEQGRLREDTTVGAIVNKLAQDVCLDQLRWWRARKRRGGRVVHSIDEFDELRATQESDVVEIHDMNGRLHAALAKLSDRDELLVRLRWFEEKSLADIAQEAGYASAGVVQVTLSRALDKLRRHLRVA